MDRFLTPAAFAPATTAAIADLNIYLETAFFTTAIIVALWEIWRRIKNTKRYKNLLRRIKGKKAYK